MEAFSWELISLLTAILSAIFNGCGLFTTEWWIGDGVKYGLFTRVTCRDHLCVLPTDDTASMHLLFTVLFTQVTCRDHVCVLLTDAQQVCICYLLYCYQDDMPGPFMYVTDRRHSKYVLTIYCIVTRVTHLDHLCVVPTDATASMYLLLTVFFLPG